MLGKHVIKLDNVGEMIKLAKQIDTLTKLKDKAHQNAIRGIDTFDNYYEYVEIIEGLKKELEELNK